MRRILIYFAIFIFILSCKEIPPYINFEETNSNLKDTTYLITNLPAPQKTKIVIEDITGVNCSNCPKAADKIKTIKAQNPGMVISIGEYPWSLSNLTAPWPGYDTMNTKEADDIFANIFNNPPGIPTGGVNRKLFNGEKDLFVSYFNWSGYSDVVKNIESNCVLNYEILSIDTVLEKSLVKVMVTFTKQYDKQLNLSLFLTEDSIYSKQHMPDGTKKTDYLHNHVLRKSLTPYSGIPLKMHQPANNYEAGRVFEKDFEIKFLPKWKIKNCKLVVLVNRFDNESKEIIQAADINFQ